MKITLFGIPNCDTVKKARAWLTAQGLDYQFHNFATQGVPAEHLQRWVAHCGWETVLNRGEGTIMDFDRFEPASFEAAIRQHPKVLFRFADG